MNRDVFSLPCKIVGQELNSFVSKQKPVSKKSFSRSLMSLGIDQVKQNYLGLKFNYDNQLRQGAIYLPLCSIFDGDVVTFSKFTDKFKLELFETTKSDLDYLFSAVNPNFNYESVNATYIVVKNVSELFLIDKYLSELNLLNVFCVLYLGDNYKIVHEQFPAETILFFNFESGVGSIKLNIIELSKANQGKAKSKFVSLMLNAVKEAKGIA